jgi:hypothetical protein
VYVELEAAPFVWRLDAGNEPVAGQPALSSHTGAPARFRTALVDEAGRLFVDTDLGFGIVHTLDMEAAAAAVESQSWRPEEVAFAGLPARFGYQLSSIDPGAAPAQLP